MADRRVSLNVPTVDINPEAMIRIKCSLGTLMVARVGDKFYFPVNYTSEMIGLVANTQVKKLQTSHWTCERIMSIRAKLGRGSPCRACIYAEVTTIPSWLNGIRQDLLSSTTRIKLQKFAEEVPNLLVQHCGVRMPVAVELVPVSQAAPKPVNTPVNRAPADAIEQLFLDPKYDQQADQFDALAKTLAELASNSRELGKVHSQRQDLVSKLLKSDASRDSLEKAISFKVHANPVTHLDPVSTAPEPRKAQEQPGKEMADANGRTLITLFDYARSVGRNLTPVETRVLSTRVRNLAVSRGITITRGRNDRGVPVNFYPKYLLIEFFANNPQG